MCKSVVQPVALLLLRLLTVALIKRFHFLPLHKLLQIEQYPPGTDFAVKAVELSERYKTRLLAVRPWCSVDARLGAATVALTETTVFDGEVHANDACDDTTGMLHNNDVTMFDSTGLRIGC
jgi:hypothetical protein